MAQQINPVDPATALILQAMNQINPVTESGNPTVAADVLSKLSQMGATQMSPSVGQAAQQAGIASQLEAMKLQKAQNALMNQAMAQGPEAVGIAPMAGAVRMAEGGIVGYANGDMAEDPGFISPEFGGASSIDVEEAARERARLEEEERRRRLEEIVRERARNMEEVVSGPYTRGDVRFPAQAAQPQVAQPRPAPEQVPAMPAQAPRQASPTTSTQLFDQARRGYGSIATLPVSPQQAIESAIADQQVMDEYRRRLGLPPEMERISRQEEQFKRLYGDRESLIQRRLEDIEAQKGLGGIAAFLRGFQQMKGQPIGTGFVSAAESGQAYDTAMRQRRERLEDLKIEIQGLSMDKQNALDKMRDDIANGRFKDAMVRREAAQKADNDIRVKQAELDIKQAQVVGQQEEARIRQQQQTSELERMLARLEGLRRTNPDAAKRMEEDIAVLRGAGRRPSGAEARQRMLELYADNWENKMDLQEKAKLKNKGINTFEDYVAYRDRIAGVSSTVSPSGDASRGAPAIGTIMDGYKFKGGNPADKANWEKV